MIDNSLKQIFYFFVVCLCISFFLHIVVPDFVDRNGNSWNTQYDFGEG